MREAPKKTQRLLDKVRCLSLSPVSFASCAAFSLFNFTFPLSKSVSDVAEQVREFLSEGAEAAMPEGGAGGSFKKKNSGHFPCSQLNAFPMGCEDSELTNRLGRDQER